jgi:hypothetical protein
VSVDTNAANFFGSLIEMRAEMIMKALDKVRELDKTTSRFKGRLGLSKVVLIGHSRGGAAAVRAALLNRARTTDRFGIAAVCGLATNDMSGEIDKITDASGTSRPGRHSLNPLRSGFFLALYGALDGDVAVSGGARGFSGTGFRHFDRATCAKAMLFFDRCCHNRFNRTWSTDEAGVVAADIPKLLSRADHEQLAIEYIRSLLRWRVKGDLKERDLFDGTKTNTLGADFSLQWSFGREMIALDEFEDPARPEVGTRATSNATIQPLADFTVGGVDLGIHSAHQTSVLGVDRNLPGPPPSASELTLPAGNRDWARFTFLTFRVASFFDVTADPPTGHLPQFTLTLVDGNGGAASVDETKVAAGSVTGFTTPVHHEINGSPPDRSLIRLETHRVKLSDFTGVDLTDVRTLDLGPPPGLDAELFFDSFRLVRP